jgi:NAD(P)-dependent dehydrogenase (short-subunit alcohol dehydrogenase family)
MSEGGKTESRGAQLGRRASTANIRANVILPGLLDTPMAVNTRARASGKSRAEVAVQPDVRVPLRRKIGTAWLMRCCYWLRMRPILSLAWRSLLTLAPRLRSAEFTATNFDPVFL